MAFKHLRGVMVAMTLTFVDKFCITEADNPKQMATVFVPNISDELDSSVLNITLPNFLTQHGTL